MHIVSVFREGLASLDMLRSDVNSELSIMEDALAMRMRNIIAGSSTSIQHLPALDLAGLHIISQVFCLIV